MKAKPSKSRKKRAPYKNLPAVKYSFDEVAKTRLYIATWKESNIPVRLKNALDNEQDDVIHLTILGRLVKAGGYVKIAGELMFIVEQYGPAFKVVRGCLGSEKQRHNSGDKVIILNAVKVEYA